MHNKKDNKISVNNNINMLNNIMRNTENEKMKIAKPPIKTSSKKKK